MIWILITAVSWAVHFSDLNPEFSLIVIGPSWRKLSSLGLGLSILDLAPGDLDSHNGGYVGGTYF